MSSDTETLNREQRLLELDDISQVYLTRIADSNSKSPVLGKRKEEYFFEFSSYRGLTDAELSPELSVSIIDFYGVDPYSESEEVESKVLREDGDEFLRVADGDLAVYFGLNDSEFPEVPDYFESEEPRWAD